jgi:hypothetical protein
MKFKLQGIKSAASKERLGSHHMFNYLKPLVGVLYLNDRNIMARLQGQIRFIYEDCESAF